MKNLRVIFFVFGLVQVCFAQNSSKEESAEQNDTEWSGNPEIELREYKARSEILNVQ